MNPLQQIEQETLEEGREHTRRMLEERLQAAAVEEMGPISPVSGLKLKRARRIGMKLHTVCGDVNLRVWYGFCSHSGRNMTPAREQGGLKPNVYNAKESRLHPIRHLPKRWKENLLR